MAVTLDSDTGERVLLYGSDGSNLVKIKTDASGNLVTTSGAAPRLMADNLSLPTAPDVLAGLMAYDTAGGNLDMVRLASPTNTNPANGLAAVMVAYDPTGSALRTIRTPHSDTKGQDELASVAALLWNPSSSLFERARGNLSTTYLASAARVATPSVTDVATYNLRGIVVFVNVTVSGGAGHGITVTIDEKDSISGVYKTVLTSVAIEATGLVRLVVCPGITVAANVSVADVLSRTLRILPTHADATSNTYSVSYDLLT